MKRMIVKNCMLPSEGDVPRFANAFDVVYHKSESELEKLFEKQEISKKLLSERVRNLNSYYHTRLTPTQIEIIVEKHLDG